AGAGVLAGSGVAVTGAGGGSAMVSMTAAGAGAGTGALATGGAAAGVTPGMTLSTSTMPLSAPMMPSRGAPVYERSIVRSPMKGPRSLTRTTTERPLATLVTST